tara:strand:+ start:1263 stop:1682 length:420 start_codon:yes stop_codon:yes gene_type:complete
MALSWDLTKIENVKELCWTPCKDEEGKFELEVVTNTLIWSTMLIGMNSITEKTSKEFHKRLIEFEIIHGEGMLIEDGKNRQPTLEEVRLHVGLKTNATPMDSRKWGSNLRRMIKEEAQRRIRAGEEEAKNEQSVASSTT